jgi:hypothetical protein
MDLNSAPSLPAIYRGSDREIHPPLHYLLLRLWMDCFGESEFSLRAMEALLSTLAVALLFDLARRLHGPAIGLCIAAVLAAAVTPIDQAQQITPYSLLLCLCLACGDALIAIQQRGASPWRMIILAYGLVAAALTHYLGCGALLAMAIYALIYFRGQQRRRTLLTFAAAAGVFLLIYGPVLLAQRHGLMARQGWLMDESPGRLGRLLDRLLQLPPRQLFGMEIPGPSAALLTLLVLVAPLLSRRRDVLFWWLWSMGTIGLLAAADALGKTKRLDVDRYALMATPAIAATLIAIWPRDKFIWRLAPAAIVLSVLIFCEGRIQQGAPSHEPWRDMVAYVDARADSHDLLIFSSNDLFKQGAWYLAFCYYAPNNHRPVMLREDNLAPPAAQLAPYSTFWLIGPQPKGGKEVIPPGWRQIAGAFFAGAGRAGKFQRLQ